jgi:hypothetical protein
MVIESEMELFIVTSKKVLPKKEHSLQLNISVLRTSILNIRNLKKKMSKRSPIMELELSRPSETQLFLAGKVSRYLATSSLVYRRFHQTEVWQAD